MKFKNLLPTVFLLIMFSATGQGSLQEYFLIKTYSFSNKEQVKVTEDYLRDAYLPSLKRLKFKNIGVFKEHIKNDSVLPKLVVLLPFSFLSDFEELDAQLNTDPDYHEKGLDYLKAKHDNPSYKRISTVLLKGMKNMPILTPSGTKGERSKRVYALRSYESATEALYKNKLKMFNEGGEIVLFDKFGFNAVFYGEVLIGPKTPNLMYMVTFDSVESEKEHWETFVASEEWKKLSKDPKYQNNLSKIDNLSLYPTEYSDY